MLKKRVFAIILLVCSVFIFSGCFDYEEMNKLMLITAIGIDIEDEYYKVSVQVVQSKGGNKENTVTMSVKTAKGKTMTDAAIEIQHLFSEPIYLQHVKMVVISREIAEKRLDELKKFTVFIGSFFDFNIVVAGNSTALEVIKAGSSDEALNTMEASEVINLNTIAAIPPSFKGYDLVSGKKDFVLPQLEIYLNEDDNQNNSEKKSKNVIHYNGGTVVSDKKAVSVIEKEECTGLLLTTGRVSECKITTKEGESITVISNDVKINLLKDDSVNVEVDLKIDGDVSSIESVEKKLSETVQNTLEKLYFDYKCDALSLFDKYNAFYNGKYKDVKDFKDNIKNLKFDCKVKITEHSNRNVTEEGKAQMNPPIKLFSLITIFLYGNSVLLKMIYGSGKDFFISLILAAVLAVITLTVIMLPFIKHPYMTAGEYILKKTGKYSSKFINSFFLIFALLSITVIYIEFIKYLSVVSLNVTPNYMIAIVISLFVLFVSLLGIKNISGFTAYFFIAVIIFIIMMVAYGISVFKPENVLPIFKTSVAKIIESAFRIFFYILADVILVIFIVGNEEQGEKVYKISLCGIGIWLVTMVTFGYLPLVVFGENFNTFKYPMHQALATFKNLSFLPKNPFQFTVISFLILFIKMSVTLCFIQKILENIIGRATNPLIKLCYSAAPIFIITITSSVLLLFGLDDMVFIRHIFAVSAIVCLLAFTILLFRKFKKKPRITLKEMQNKKGPS